MTLIPYKKALRVLLATLLFAGLMALAFSGAGWVQPAQAAISLPSWCPVVPTVPAVPVPAVPTFPDVPSSFWGFEFIETLAFFGYIAGFDDGNFYPTVPTDRAQMAVLIERADKGTGFTPPAPAVPPFPDVPVGHWAAAWIAAAKSDNFVSGFPDGNYYPSNDVLRDQGAVFITGLHQGSGFTPTMPTLPPFPDVPLSHWAVAWIAQVLADELMLGFPDGNFHPANPLTRAQVSVMLTQALCLPGFP